jgi:hypothetical protein
MPLTRPLLLHGLTKPRLRDLILAFGLKLAAAEAKDAHIELLLRSRKAALPAILAHLTRDELKEACRLAGLDTTGREKTLLIARLLGDASPERPLDPALEPALEPALDPALEPQPPPALAPRAPRETAPTSTVLEPGQLVHVRARRYLIDQVLPPPRPGDATLLRLACIDDDAQGDPLEVLWEHELDARILGRAAWDDVTRRGFDRPERFAAYLHTLRWSCVTATNPRLFQAPYRAGIDVKAYQLEPLRRALEMPRVRLFIADDVGLGKTIEAGLIVREMLLRQRIRRIVVAAPPSVVRQWQEEMEQRFGLAFVILDRDYLARVRQERGYGQNPWATHTRFIISHALLRDEAYAAPLRDWLDTQDLPALLILDEAHNAAPASGARYAVDSHLTRTLRELAPRFEHRLFLSATPHNGHSNSFAALLEILDPDRFCRGVTVDDPALLDAVMVRRLKSDLRELAPGEFPERRIIPETITELPDDAPELLLARLLADYRDARDARLQAAPRASRAAAMLVLTTLQKRLLSSIEAFAVTLAAHRRAVLRQLARAAPAPVSEDLSLPSAPTRLDLPARADAPDADDDRAELTDAELADADADAIDDLSAAPDAPISPDERALLDRMAQIADAARHRPDARLRRLLDWIRQYLCPDLGQPGAPWLPRRVLIFTEYADTKRYLLDQLGTAIADTDRGDERLRAFHGGMGDELREAIKAAFNADPHAHPLRILVATDAAREGVNLQNHCADLFHFDVPWNPSRMEQRNGRIDRKLQRAPVVTCRYFVLPQRPEDRVLDALVRKTATIKEQLGSLSPVIVRDLEGLLAAGINPSQEAALTRAIAAVEPRRRTLHDLTIDRELEVIRTRQLALKSRVDELQELLRASRDWLGLSDVALRAALCAALDLLGAPPLAPEDPAAAHLDPAAARWCFPALDPRRAQDPAWQAALDALRPPRARDQKLHEWRRQAPLRPLVFRDPGTLDGQVVHLHLEHRLVQRLLGRFLTQGFIHDELTRAAVARTDDPVPKVIVLGRLSLYGPHAARLHDEILAVAAEWVDPDLRGKAGKRLTPLADSGKKDALAELESALVTPHLQKVPAAVGERLRAHAQADVDALLPHLERRARERLASAEAALSRRGDAEAKALHKVIRHQITQIEARLAAPADPQLSLELAADPQGQRQFAADRRFWQTRLPQLQAEAERGPARIRAGYAVSAVRVDPIGLAYLWPVTS